MLFTISPEFIRCATKFPLLFFLMKMQLYCEKMVINESFKVLPIVSYNFCPSFWYVWGREAERCHAVESLFRASARIVAVFRAVLGSNASIAFDTVPR